MDSILVFNKNAGPAHLVASVGEVEKQICVQFYLWETNKEERCVLAECRNFLIVLGFYNSVYLEVKQEKFLIFPNAQCWTWNWIRVLNGKVEVNGLSHGVPVFFANDKMLFQVGNSALSGLIRVSKNVNTENFKVSQGKHVGNFQPIKSLAELQLWEGKNPEHQSRIPYSPSKKSSTKELLVCHDCGSSNYKNDIGPTSLPSTYRYFHYMHTDMFIYFSHSRISIPPVSWTDTAHRNKTLMLGTFITENEEGTKENKKLSENINFYAQLLTNLMVYYGFDGYLINIEAKSENPESILEFLETLTLLSHSSNSYSKILWYDSMDLNGEIRWKSELNPGNLQFLQVCDGFFTDYHWKPGMPQKSAETAAGDQWKVYTGTDVYGRGTWGGGGYDTKIGVEESSCTSCAIFAPGWTWEKISGGEFSAFFEAEKLMWAQRANPIIDSGGKINKNRENVNKFNALNKWEVFVSPDKHNNESFNWKKANNGEKYWEVNENLEFVASFVKSKRVTSVNFAEIQVRGVNFVYGTVEVKGTGPKENDYYWVELKIRTFNGQEMRKVESGQTGAEWKIVKLEIKAEEIAEVTWTESGFDIEYWQGFYGSRFRNTQVVYKQQGNCLLDNFEEKILLEPFCTWFSLGQGPKLWSKGTVILDKTWNSLHDFDLMPNFLVLSQLEPNFEQVFHGTNSLHVPVGNFQLFRCDFSIESLNIKFYYKGKISLVLEGAQMVECYTQDNWNVDCYLVTGHVGNIGICAEQESYLAGLHLFNGSNQYKFSDFEYKVHWNPKSLNEPKPVFDLSGSFKELPTFVRHVDVYLNKSFNSRIYSTEFLLKEISAALEATEMAFIAESMQGEILDTHLLTITPDLIESVNPLYLINHP